MVAAWSNELKIAKDLVERGVPVNARDVHGAIALMSASQTCLDGKMVQLLLDARADPNAKSEANDTALTIAADNGMLWPLRSCSKPEPTQQSRILTERQRQMKLAVAATRVMAMSVPCYAKP